MINLDFRSTLINLDQSMALTVSIDREAREIMHLVASVCPSVRLSVCALTAEPSAEKGNMSHYQFKVFVCVSLISGCMQIIARMRSIAILI